MITTIRRLIENKGLDLEQTVYDTVKAQVLDYPMTVGDFFDCDWGLEKGKSFRKVFDFYQMLLEEEERNGVPRLQKAMEDSHERLTQIKKAEKGKERKEQLEMLKSGRRGIREALEWFQELAGRNAVKRFGPDPQKLHFLEYKNRVMVTDYENITNMIPALGRTRYEEMWDFPWLTTDLEQLKRCVEQGEGLGIIGGPCIFGIDEVLIRVRTRDGDEELFDCSCGRQCTKDHSRHPRTLAGYIKEKKGEIKELRILNRKKGITKQEFISILYVFETARLLNAKVVIPLPDLSYVKYMEADLEELPPELKGPVMEEFAGVTDQVADLFLEVIETIRNRYPSVEAKVLHRRDEELCGLFYEKREPFIRNSSYMRKLTQHDGRKESVVDYITMLALPYYLFGTRQILQLDSLDETDSGRKCQKLHGEKIVLHSMLYPEFLSRDGMNTLYNTTLEYKDYLKRGDYERWLEDGKI